MKDSNGLFVLKETVPHPPTQFQAITGNGSTTGGYTYVIKEGDVPDASMMDMASESGAAASSASAYVKTVVKSPSQQQAVPTT